MAVTSPNRFALNTRTESPALLESICWLLSESVNGLAVHGLRGADLLSRPSTSREQDFLTYALSGLPNDLGARRL